MTIIFEEKNNKHHILVTEVIENNEILFPKIKNELSNAEITRYNGFKNKKRKTEWLGVRLTLKRMLGKYYEILYINYATSKRSLICEVRFNKGAARPLEIGRNRFNVGAFKERSSAITSVEASALSL